jgi:vacuolar-type H+-ATPase subunit I/STV1
VGYLDKEVLAPMRKNLGVEVSSADLTKLRPGEWIVVTRGGAEKLQFTVKRKTPHGAETPSLERVPEASQKVKKTAGELALALRQLVEKEKEEENEVEKMKRKIKELEKQLQEAEKKAEIKIAVKEMLGSAGNNELEKKLGLLIEENSRLKEEKKQLLQRISLLEEEKKKSENYSTALDALKSILMPGLDYEAITKEVIKRLNTSTDVSMEKPTITVKAERPEIKADESGLRGVIALLIHEGYFDSRKSLSQIRARLKELGYDEDEKKVEAELVQLCRWRILDRSYTDRYWYRATDEAKNRIAIK